MYAVANRFKSATVAGVVALGLCSAATSASAEAKVATPNWNMSSFAIACGKSPNCHGGALPGGKVSQAIIVNPGTTTTVTCDATKCVYSTAPTTPGRPAPKVGKNLGLDGVTGQGKMASPRMPAKKLDAGQDVPRQIKGQVGRIDTPKVDVPRQIKVDVPKVSAPTTSLKDTKVNVVR